MIGVSVLHWVEWKKESAKDNYRGSRWRSRTENNFGHVWKHRLRITASVDGGITAHRTTAGVLVR